MVLYCAGLKPTLGRSELKESMQILCPALSVAPEIELDQRHSPNFHIADKPSIAGNTFQFSSGIDLGAPTGGGSHPTSMYFDQDYLYYLFSQYQG